jgi:hypothetical protein
MVKVLLAIFVALFRARPSSEAVEASPAVAERGR